ncbi:hypothetical protein SUGI_0699700 [Cryptomeria japonica]|uniref:putative UPF0481 protein At3g02645 n=1 Tax=Cryptomeria japonica TaxID=3369 RepID=UPI002414770A|nr:putative UPF0481 protein At3g02645 [Cryptomeria japonica]XP_057871893.1 putative UPF0481 protein At3g02645 [Cryptomeria japonica]XP_057871894.1 putative UPF0481 protein At3g02645 [Cryptomeria japonica]XP_057871895.1 putative UPF0481 protein At3g02645 [Cryptomeria japonica]GLJ34764.1 hypothetical protein SUGI_0699700 [Cryptomeria japonica]
MTELKVSSSSKNKKISEVDGESQAPSNPLSGSWVIEVKHVFGSKSKMLHSSMWELSRKVCIYRVPKSLMISKGEAYVPLVVSLGPYHHQTNSILTSIDQQKLKAVDNILRGFEMKKLIRDMKNLDSKIREFYDGTTDCNDNQVFETVKAKLTGRNQNFDSQRQAMDQHMPKVDEIVTRVKATKLIEEIKNLDSEIREHYDETIDSDEETLSWILTMDACFILEFFRIYRDGNTVHWDILNDIMKLENQIPLSVIKVLLKLKFKREDDVTSHLTGLLPLKMFTGFPFNYSSSSGGGKSFGKLIESIKKNPCHLLDLQRMVIKDLLTDSNPESATDGEPNGCASAEWCIIVPLPMWVQRLSCTDILNRLFPTDSHDRSTPCAESLHKVGIRFQRGQVGFESGKLSLPQIEVNNITETLLRNLMAYEECQKCSFSPDDTVISHFVCFLDDLVESEKDVSILKEAGIIKSNLGSDKEVADIFNHLRKGITVEQVNRFKCLEVAQQARTYYYSKWKKPIRRVKDAYCSKPLYWVPILAATAILVMTAVQMVYAIKKG